MKQRKILAFLTAGVAAGALTAGGAFAQGLSGKVTSEAEPVMEGVLVSARREGSTITTSVYTDTGGSYVFPPMAAGKYRVWAQALGFEQTKAQVDLSANKKQDISLKTIADPETRWKQLPGELVMASLPEDSAEDVHMKQLFNNNCNGCHTPSYPLQFRFERMGATPMVMSPAELGTFVSGEIARWGRLVEMVGIPRK